MKLSEEGLLLRIYVGESDRWHDRLLYEAIVLRAREMGLAGATVLRGLAGFGASSRIHTAKLLRLSEDLPVVIEIADEAERIERFLPVLDEMITEGLVTLERVRVILYRHRPQPAQRRASQRPSRENAQDECRKACHRAAEQVHQPRAPLSCLQ